MEAREEWMDARDNARAAISDYEQCVVKAAKAERDYYSAKAVASAQLRADNTPVTYIEVVIKGMPDVSDKLFAFRLADGELTAAKMACNLFIQEEAHTYDQYKRVMAGDSERF